MTTSCARSRAPSFAIAWLTWVRAVAGLRNSFGADLVVAQALSDQGQHLALALGQHRQPVLADLGGGAVRR